VIPKLVKVNGLWFTRLYRGVLTLIALYLVFNSHGSDVRQEPTAHPHPDRAHMIHRDSTMPWKSVEVRIP
jgi:hypothetical protein